MLSEEEKKAIKLLEDIKNNSWTTKYIMSSDSKNADILLNLITKLQKENEILKRAFDKQTADMSNNLLELRQKDKQIDLMARAFKQDDVRSVEEIKEYFEKQAKEEGE